MSEAGFAPKSLEEVSRSMEGLESGWLVEGLVPLRGVTLVVGAPRSGKTMLLSALTANVLLGEPFLERKTERKRVLWISEDRGRLGFISNIKRACHAEAVDLSAPLIYEPVGFSLDEDHHFDELLDHLDRLGVEVVIIDCLRRVTRAEENSSTSMAEVVKRLNLIASDKRSVIVVHHAGANGRARGSTDLIAGAESEIKIKSSGSNGISIEAFHHIAESVKFFVEPQISSSCVHFTIRDTMTSAPKTRRNVEQEVLELIRSTEGGIGVTEIRNTIKGGNTAIDAALQNLLARKAITRDTKGRPKKYFIKQQTLDLDP